MKKHFLFIPLSIIGLSLARAQTNVPVYAGVQMAHKNTAYNSYSTVNKSLVKTVNDSLKTNLFSVKNVSRSNVFDDVYTKAQTDSITALKANLSGGQFTGFTYAPTFSVGTTTAPDGIGKFRIGAFNAPTDFGRNLVSVADTILIAPTFSYGGISNEVVFKATGSGTSQQRGIKNIVQLYTNGYFITNNTGFSAIYNRAQLTGTGGGVGTINGNFARAENPSFGGAIGTANGGYFEAFGNQANGGTVNNVVGVHIDENDQGLVSNTDLIVGGTKDHGEYAPASGNWGIWNNSAYNNYSKSPWAIGFSSLTVPKAKVHIGAGTATANTAPLKLTTGVAKQTTLEAGAVNYDGTDIYLSDATLNYSIAKGIKGSATLNFASTAAQSSSELTLTVTGATDGDIVQLGVPNAATNANSCFTAWVSAANTVSVKFNNYSSAAIDPASGTFKIIVLK